jgi:isocitrate/isopropylmalate dehydrogenase
MEVKKRGLIRGSCMTSDVNHSPTPSGIETNNTIRLGIFKGDGRAKEVAEYSWIVPQLVNESLNTEFFRTETLPYDAEYYLRNGQAWPEGTPKLLKEKFDAFALTAFGDARVPGTMAHAKPIILDFLRGNAAIDNRDSLFTNYNRRPCELWDAGLVREPVRQQFGFKLHVISETGFRVEEHVENPGTIQERVSVKEYHEVNAYTRLVDQIAPKVSDDGEHIAVVLKSNVYNFAHLPVEKLLKERYAEANQAYLKAGKPPFIKFYNADAFCFEMVDHPERMPRHIVTDPVFGTILRSGISALNQGLLAKTPSNFYAEVGREAVSGQYICQGEIIDPGIRQVGVQRHLHTAHLIKENLRRAAQIAVEKGWIEISVIHNGGLYPETARLMERCAHEIGKERAVFINFVSMEEFFRMAVANPEQLNQVILTALNLEGDIASDALAARCGGLGCAPSLSETTDGILGFRKGVYVEPVHGSAPDLEPNRINPTGMLASMSLLLDHYNLPKHGNALRDSIKETIRLGIRTKDMPQIPTNMTATTEIFGITVLARFKQKLGISKI